jgi:hypothetical protein
MKAKVNRISKRRPKTLQLNLSARQSAALQSKWRRWIRRLATDVGHQQLDNEMFRELRAIVEANPKIQNPADVHVWIVKNYVTTASLSVRRIADKRTDSHSLWTLLYELLLYPRVITRARHRALYRIDKNVADRAFDELAGQNPEFLSSRMIRADLQMLEDRTARLYRYTNRRLAHLTRPGAVRRIPTFEDLRTTLDVLEHLVTKYHVLLTAEGFVRLKPQRQHNWKTVLFEPWVPKEGRDKNTFMAI